MIVGLGIDIAELSRIARAWDRFGSRFGARILSPFEMERLPLNPVAYLASRFAAKEAAAKALGTGFTQGITFQDMDIRSNALGKPELLLHDQALARAHHLGARRIELSISHSRENAVAVVILES